MDNVKEKKDEIVLKARTISVVDDETYKLACHLLIDISSLQSEIDRTFDPVIKAANDAHKKAIAAKKDHSLPLENAKNHLLVMKNAWDRKKKLELEAEERRIREEAEKERRRLEKEEEEKRLKAAIEIEEEAGKLRGYHKIQEAIKLEIEAEKLIVTPSTIIQTPPQPPIRNTPIVSGVTTVKVWKWEVVDVNLIPREFLLIDSAAINRVMRETKEKEKLSIPGIRFYQDSTTRIG